MRRELDEAMRATTEQLSQVTNLLAIVSAPPIGTTTIKHVEVLLLQPQVAMVVVITSTGGVTKRVVAYDEPVDPGLVKWAGEYLNDQLVGMGLGARMLHGKLHAAGPGRTPSAASWRRSRRRSPSSRRPPRTRSTSRARRACCPRSGSRTCPRSTRSCARSSAASRCSRCCARRSSEPSVYLRIGHENELPELRSLSVVAANYGLPGRSLGAVSVLGPVRMDYPSAIVAVREAAAELSRFVGVVYDE